jgi:hypothetical protein
MGEGRGEAALVWRFPSSKLGKGEAALVWHFPSSKLRKGEAPGVFSTYGINE